MASPISLTASPIYLLQLMISGKPMICSPKRGGDFRSETAAAVSITPSNRHFLLTQFSSATCASGALFALCAPNPKVGRIKLSFFGHENSPALEKGNVKNDCVCTHQRTNAGTYLVCSPVACITAVPVSFALLMAIHTPTVRYLSDMANSAGRRTIEAFENRE